MSDDGGHFDRLESLVHSLLERFETLREDHAAAQRGIAERDERIRGLDERLLALGQGRQDAVKRIDELIAQLDQVEADLERRLDDAGAGD
jgi:chromosome segregation ATPase